VREYETTLIVQPEITDEGIASLQQRLDGTLESAKGIRLLYDDLGKRRLAYEIQNFQKGRYVMLRFLDEGTAIPGLERALRLEDSVIRFLTVQVNDRVEDIAARQAAAAEEQRIRAEKAAERAAREAEEAQRLETERAEAELRSAAERELHDAQAEDDGAEPIESDTDEIGSSEDDDLAGLDSEALPDSTVDDETDEEVPS
jgi:small subunit ribosomal protein S6